MNRTHRHLALILGGFGLLGLILLAPRGAEFPSMPGRVPSSGPVAEAPRPADAATEATPAPNPALSKQAEQALARAAAPITGAGAGGPAPFVVKDHRVNAFFTDQGVTLALLGRAASKHVSPSTPGWSLRWGITGARKAAPRPEGEQAARVNVIKGAREDWKLDQKTYARVVYDEVRPGVRMTVESVAHGLKYSLSAQKASDVEALRLRYEGAAALRASADGKSIEISAGDGALREDGLIVTQDGRPIESTYRVTGSDEYAIDLHGADPDRPVEVDPVLGWSSFLGGTLTSGGGSDYGLSVKVDGSGNMYVGGYTYSGDFPSVAGHYDVTLGGYQDGFVIKISSAGTVAWATYLGGSNYDEVRSIAIDGASPPNVYATGYTDSSDFPIVGAVVDPTFNNTEAFVTRINGNGNGVAWSTFLGGSSSEYGQSIAVDAAGSNVWVAGYTYSTDFPTSGGFDNSPSVMPDGFVTKLTTNGTAYAYSSFVGGSSSDYLYAMAVDASGAAYLTGYTYSSDLPLAGTPYRNFNSGGADCFVVKVKPLATALEWGTYIGGSSTDVAQAITVDAGGFAYITGYTYSADYPTPGGIITTNQGNGDAFLTKLNTAGSNLVFSSFVGGTDSDYGQAVVVDSTGRGIVIGTTYSSAGLPIGAGAGAPAPYDSTHNGGGDIFITAWTPAGSPLSYSSYVGGTSYETLYAATIDASNNLYLVGETSSPPSAGPGAFPLSSAPNPLPFDSTLSGGQDAFLLRISTALPSLTLTYGTYVGGANAIGDDYGRKIAVDGSNNLFVTGVSYSADFPTTAGVLQPGLNGTSSDVTVTKFINATTTPTLSWSTYLGGSSSEEPCGIAVDAGGLICVAGYTYSFDFPLALFTGPTGSADVFAVKMTAAGTGLSWSRVMGGSSGEYPQAMAVNAGGDIAVTGYTYSSDYPASALAYQTLDANYSDAFVALFSGNGSGIPWRTYYGGNDDDYGFGVAFDGSGQVCIAGHTWSTNLPFTASAAQTTNAGRTDFFVARFDPSLFGAAQLKMATYFGGPDYETAIDLALGPSDNVFVAGNTSYSTFPSNVGPGYRGGDDVVLLKLQSNGSYLWSGYLGGGSTDYVRQIRVDGSGSPYVIGYTYSIDFPSQGAFQPSLAGNADVFITKVDNAGGSIDWSTFLGGSESEYPYGLFIGSGGTVYVVGETYSSNFPTLNPYDSLLTGGDYFVTRIDNSNPSTPSSLSQTKAGGSALGIGGWSKDATFIVLGTVGDLDDDNVALQVELQPIDVAFTGTVSATSAFGASGGQRSVSVTFPGGATQQFHWRARAIDINSRVSSWLVFGGNSDGAPPGTPAARDVGHDTTNPVVTTATPTSGSTYTTAVSPISFTGGMTDDLSGAASVTWVNNLGGSGSATGAGSWSVPSIALSAASGGINVITFTGTDNAGNTGTKVVTVTYDTTAPVTAITSPTSSLTYGTGTGPTPSSPPSGSITLGGTISEANTVSSVTWVNGAGGSGNATIGGSAPNWTWSAAGITLTPGANLITVTAFDGANNSQADQITVNYDNVPPSVNITTAPFTTASATADIAGTASDASNGISAVTWVNSGGGSGAATPPLGSWTISGIPLAAGANIVTVTATDGVPNFPSTLNQASAALTIYRDTAAPVITIVSPTPSASPPGFVTGNSVITVSGTATDDLNVASVTWINPTAGINTPQAASLSGPATSRSWTANVTLAGGNNLITFSVSDGVRPDVTAQTYITLSTAAPTLSVSNPAASPAVTATTPFPLAGVSGASAPATSITGVTVENLTTSVFAVVTGTTSWSAPVDLVIGSNTIEIIATDNLGLFTTVTRTLILDPTAPAITITGPSGAATYSSPSNSVVLSGVASDNRSIASILWSNTTTGTLNQSVTPVGPPTSVTWTTSAIPLNLGANTIILRATDDAGNFSEDTITVTYDTTLPGITITSPTSAPVATTTLAGVALGGTASDNIGLQVVTWVNAATGASGTATGTTTWSTASISLSLGANPITVIAIDTAGNTQTDSILVFRDGAAPSVTITSPTSDPTLSTATATLSLGGTAADDVQISSVTWTRNPGGLTGSASGGTAWSIASIPLVAGTNTITVTATDGASQSANDVITVSYDPTAPTISISTPASDPFSTTTTPLILTGIAGDNIAVTEVTWTNVTTGGSGSASGTVSWNCLTPLTSGNNLITVTAMDAAGNTAVDSITVVYDPAAPLIAITSPTTGLSIATRNTPITIGGTASDDVGVAAVTWSTNGAVVVQSGTAAGTDSWSFSVELAPGENVITVTAADGVGRTGTAFLTVIYDPTPPSVTINTPTTDPTYNTTQATLNLAGVANDNRSLQGVTWTNAATAAGGNTLGVGAWSIANMALNEGPNLVTVTATDSVNNSGSAAITIVYDGTDPLLAIDPPNPALLTTFVSPFGTSTRPFPITGTASDNLNLAGVTWSSDRGGGGTATLVPPGAGPAPRTWSASVYLVSGINIITVTATDAHGRTATSQVSFDYTPENTAPNIIINTPAAGPGAPQVAAFSGSADDNVGIVGVTWRNRTTGIRGTATIAVPGINPIAWSANVPLTTGDNVLEATAVDDAGNTATATITVNHNAAADGIEPAVDITGPTALDLYSSSVSPLTLTVTATDLGGSGVAVVRWTNEGTGGSGTGTPGTLPDEWTMDVPLAFGTNVITVTAIDANGNSDTDTIIVTFAPTPGDSVAPTVTLTSHTPGSSVNVTTALLTLTGTASDNVLVTTVIWADDASGLTGAVEGTTSWTIDVTLEVGINVLTLKAYDSSGNTGTVNLTVVYTPPPPPPEVVPAGSCGLVGLDALALLALAAAWRRRRSR